MPVTADSLGKEPVAIVELDLDRVTSSTSAADPDGNRCYKTPTTSTYWAPLTVGTRTRRFLSRACRPMRGLDAVPSVLAATYTDDALELGQGLPSFGEVRITLLDHQDDDRVEDPYYSSRSPAPTAGSYWRRLLRRNPYVYGRVMRLKLGYRSDTYASGDFTTRTYLIREISGPTQDGIVTIIGCSPLAMVSLDAAQAPAPTYGTLATAIAADATSMSLADPADASDYGADGHLTIGDEVCAFTRSSNVFTLTRAQKGTAAAEHEAGDGVQKCAVWTGSTVAEVLQHLLHTYAGIDSSYLPTTDWAEIASSWLSLHLITACLPRPEPVKDLVSSLLEEAGCCLYWDAVAAQLVLSPLRPPLPTAISIWTDAFHLVEPLSVERDMTKRVSRCDVLFGLRSATADPTGDESYRVRLVGAAQGETAIEHGTPARLKILARWLDATQSGLAARISQQYATHFVDGRIRYRTAIAAKDADGLALGDSITLQTRDLVDLVGDPEDTLAIVVDISPIIAGHTYRITLEKSTFAGRWAWAMDDDTDPYATATTRDPGAFAADDDELMANNDPGYKAQ